jgi:hypothetical protein
MNILNEIVALMNKEEVRHFKLFTSRTNVGGIRKDLQLFDYVRKSGDAYEEEKIYQKLYPDSSKNPFYRLKNRLLNDLNKSLNLQHIDDDDIVHIFHLLSLARFFQNRNKYKVSFHFLRKAEKKAIRLDNYELLDFIYSELIKLTHEIIFINPEEYIQKRKVNREKLRALREIDDVLAAVIYRVKVSQNLSSTKNPIFDLLEQTVAEFTQNAHVRQDPKLRFTIYHAVSRILLARNDYKTLESYLLATYDEFTGEGLFTKANHDTKLQMLVYIVNTLYNTRKLEMSLEYADKLKASMEEHGGMLHQKYLMYYYNALIINYSILDPNKSTEIVERVIKERTFKESPYNEFLMIINLAICYFNERRFGKALKALVGLYIHDGYAGAGAALRLRIAIFELTLRTEASDFEIAEKRIEDVRKEFAEQLGEEGESTERELIMLMKDMNRSINISRDKELRDKVRHFIETTPREELESFSFIDYHEWLKRKVGMEG